MMYNTPFEALTDTDKKLINFYIDEFSPNNFDAVRYVKQRKSLEEILKEWNTCKKDLFKLFDGELIKRRLFSYKQSTEGLTREFETCENRKPYNDFMNWWNINIEHSAIPSFEIEYTSPVGYIPGYKFFYINYCFKFEVLAKNAYEDEEYKITFSDGTVFKVSKGMKPMKILHKFVEKYGDKHAEELFEKFRLWHSQLLNQKTVDGELCLSIHPLDFMTMSDNNNGWSSCMRWADKCGHPDPGDYRAGTVECMNSPYILVAYLHNPKHTYNIRNEFEWNSKRWRELFIVNDGLITEIKGYPYQDENLTNGCISWIKELAQNNLGWTYDDEEYEMNQAIMPDGEDGDIIMFEYIKPNHMYMDMGCLKKHSGRINLDNLRNNKKYYQHHYTDLHNRDNITIEIPYGGLGTCMYCGGPLEEEERDNYVLCGYCEQAECCCLCGEILGEDRYWIEELDDYVCYDCYCDRIVIDSFAEEPHIYENMTSINLLLGYDCHHNPVFYDNCEAYCYEPNSNYVFQQVFNKPIKYDDKTYRNYVTLDMINEGHTITFCNAFEIWPRDLNKFYIDCIDTYDLVYDYNGNLLYEDREEEADKEETEIEEEESAQSNYVNFWELVK